MTIRHLKIFVTVCECGSTTKASELLYIAQPTISHTISELEKYYKVVLFERINQRLVLTDIGQELLIKAKEILDGFNDFESLAAFKGENPIVKIGATLTLGQTVIPSFLQRMEKELPNVQAQVIIRPYADIEKEIENGNIDFAIVEGEVSSQMVKTTPLKKDKLTVVSNVDFDIPTNLSFEELVNYPLLLREKGNASRDYFESVTAKKNIHFILKVDSVNNQALISAVYNSIGITVLPDSFVRGHINRGKFKEIFVDGLDVNYTNYIIIHKNKKLNRIQKEAYDFLCKLG